MGSALLEFGTSGQDHRYCLGAAVNKVQSWCARTSCAQTRCCAALLPSLVSQGFGHLWRCIVVKVKVMLSSRLPPAVRWIWGPNVTFPQPHVPERIHMTGPFSDQTVSLWPTWPTTATKEMLQNSALNKVTHVSAALPESPGRSNPTASSFQCLCLLEWCSMAASLTILAQPLVPEVISYTGILPF